MNWIHRRLAVLRSRSARTLLAVSVALTLLIAVVAFVGTFLISVINEVILLQSYINTLPILAEERMGEMDRVDRAYMDDYVACGDIARTMYDRYDTLEPNRRLELACRHAGAINVTLLDGGGHFIASATGERPSRAVSAAYEAADQNESELFDPNMEGVNNKVVNSEDFDPETDGMPMVYWSELADGSFLMVEMDYTPYGQVLNDLFTWDSVFERAMTGLDGFGFLRFEDGTLYGYPLEDLTGEQALVLQNEAQAVFDGLGDSPLKLSVYEGDEVHFSVTNLLGEPHLVVGTPTDASGLTYMLAVPVGSFAGFMLLCDLSVVVLVVVGFVLFSRYATQSFRRDAIETTDARLRARTARVRAFPGIAVVLVVTGALSAMLFMLEGLSNTARNTTTQHETIDWEADYLTRRKNTVEQEYTSRYRQRSTAMARLLSDFPELRTQERLREFNELCRSEHLMLFDQEGNELFDSHDFTGFSVDDETYGRPEWRAVLKGYIQVETPSAVNPFTGQYERTIATHVTDVEGHPDGFLLMFVNDDDLMAEIGGASLEGAVSGFIPRGGQMAAVVDNHTGLFTAHTDPSMIGEEAASYLSPEVIGRNFDGFTTYAGKMTDVYVSGVSSDGKTTLVITDSVANDATALSSVVIIGIILLLILVVFYPVAAPLCARRVEELPVRGPEDEDHPLMVFYRGYTAYLAVLCVVSFLGAVFGFWKAFEAVYGGDWTPGLHLFSIWMALFVGSMLSYVTTGLHRILGYVEGQSSTRTKTYARLVDSLASYVIAVLEMVLILTYLGVDTATIIGSVSIISIAIGMGSQDLVKDIVAGLFLVFEGTISVGDIVEVGGWHGRVTDMGIRTTEITNDRNDVKILANSKIGDVVNMSKVKTSCTEEFTLPRTVDLDDLGDLVSTYIASIVEDVPEVRDSLRMGEVLAISEDSYTVQLTYLVNEADRESVTIRLRNAMQLLLESDKG